MLKDAKISTKVIVALLVALLVAVCVGFLGRQSLIKNDETTRDIAEIKLPTLASVQQMVIGQLHVAAAYRGLSLRRMMDPQSRQANYAELEDGLKQIESGKRIYESLPMAPSEVPVWQRVVPALDEWRRHVQALVDYHRQKDNLVAQGIKLDDPQVVQVDQRAFEEMIKARDSRKESGKLLGELAQMNQDLGIAAGKSAEAATASSVNLITTLLIGGLLAILAIAYTILRSVNSTISNLIAEGKRLAEAAVNGQLATRGDPMVVTPEFRPVVQGVNDTLDAVIGPLNVAAEYVDKISKGDIPPKITDHYNGDFNNIKNNLNQCIDAVNTLVADAGVLSKAAVEGKLATRADANKHQGDFRKIVQGVNETLDSVIGPLNVAADYVDKISKGNIPQRITDKYNGDFNTIKNNLNQCIDAVNSLVADASVLSRAAVEGKLATRADATKHQGDFRKIVQGVNETLDSVIGPLNVAADYVDKISKGNIPNKITDNYNGDFNTIKNNLNQCIDAVNQLTADAGVLAKAAVEGRLATRADATKHQGDFRKIVQGVNDTLDSVIGPLNVAADYVDKISKGNIPQKITDKYNGDFNTIKNNLNQCIDAVNLLVAEAGVLSKAAVEGRLATRADASKHQGDFRKIVQGVNETLDAVIGPLNVAADYVDKISKGNIPNKITDNYNGDFNTIKTNLNQCIEAVNQLVGDAGVLAKAAVEGKLATRADATKHHGDFRKIVQGVNDTLDAVIGPLNVAADYVDKISKGNIPNKITDKYNGDFNTIKNNLNQCIEAVNLLVADAGVLAKAAVEGKLATRADATKHQGDFRKIVQGVNETLDAVIGPLNVAADYVDKISKGNIPNRITDTYNGDFNTIKNNLNQCIEAVNLLVADAGTLAKAAVDGKLATRADATKHQGDFRKIVQGVNDTLDSVIGPLNVAAEYVDKISKGNIPNKITDTYNGDFNTIKNNLNQCIEAVNKLVADAGVLATAAVEGKLATRADATKHQGDFRKIVQGVNETLDSVIGPLNVAADYVDKISKGNIPAKITDAYNGDFNTIKNNLNQCIEAVNILVGDAQMLSQAAVEGRLSTRADATKHAGDFRRIVEGVNKTLDAVIDPIVEATTVLESLSHYDLRSRVMGEYNGDHARIKTALNSTGKALHDALSQVADAVEQVSEASRQIASSSQSVAQGASEQASSLEETSSSLEEMSGMTKQNADNTIQARSLAQSTKEAAEKGGHAMTRMIDAMEKIRAASEGTSEIIKDINDIAFQTNLLALNAAVEAARAGDAGRGFAVVAEEVRSLALRSKEAAKKTEDLIKMSVGHAENGRVISGEVAGSLNEIVSAAGKVNDIVSEIAVASQEQSRGIEQVNSAVGEMDKVVQVAAANAEESSSAAEELSSQSEELTSLVSRFQLERESSRRAATKRDAVSADLRRRTTASLPVRRAAPTPQARQRPPVASGTNGTRKPAPEEVIPFEGDPEFKDF